MVVSDAAHEALAEYGVAYSDEPRRGLLGVGESDRRGRVEVEVELRDASLGNHGVTVEQYGRVAVPLYLKRSFERRREAKRHLNRAAIKKCRQRPRRVPAIRGRQRPPETAWKGELHEVSSTWGQTPRVGPHAL